jgi:hypothetical protein
MSVAASSFAPNASMSRGTASPAMSKSESSTTLIGIGTMTASSRTSRYLLAQLISLVCLSPVSPETQ